MNPAIGRRYKRLLVFILVLAVPVGVLLFFYRMYNDDIKAIKDFISVYERFDQVVSGLDQDHAADLDSEAGRAVKNLSTKAALKLSSLIKNDAGLMDQALEVADLGRREIESLMAYRLGIKNENADVDELAEASRALTGKRKEAYARFHELGGVR